MLKKTTQIVQISNVRTLPKFAAKIQSISPVNPDFRYIRFRAIGNLEVDGPNQNWDGFPYEELADDTPNYGWKTFVGKRAHVEHNSYSVENAIGELLDAYFNEFTFPEKFSSKKWKDLDSKARLEIIGMENQNDGSVEVLMAIDSKLAPKIARMVDSGMTLSCSMGTNIRGSNCSVCGNYAEVEEQYCQHVAKQKGQTILCGCEDIRKLLKEGKLKEEWLKYVLPREYDRQAVLGTHCRTVLARVFEINYGLNFFELSVVGNPAYPRAYQLERVASKKESNIDRIKKFYGEQRRKAATADDVWLNFMPFKKELEGTQNRLQKIAGSVDGEWLQFKPFKKESTWGLIGTYIWESYAQMAHVFLIIWDHANEEMVAIVYSTEIPDEGDEVPEKYYRSEVGDATINQIYNTLSFLSKEQILSHPSVQVHYLSEALTNLTEEQRKIYENTLTQDKKLFLKKMKEQGLDLGDLGIKGNTRGNSKWGLFRKTSNKLRKIRSWYEIPNLSGYQFTDRYDASGIGYPDPKTMCHGQCEGTGYIPVYDPFGTWNGNGSGVTFPIEETDSRLAQLWQRAELEKPTDDGWHFVKCSDCNGTGKRSELQEIARRSIKLSMEQSYHEHSCQCGGSCGCKTKKVAAAPDLGKSIAWWVRQWYGTSAWKWQYISEYMPEIEEEFLAKGFDEWDLQASYQGGENAPPIQELKSIVDSHFPNKRKQSSLSDLPRQDPEQKEKLVEKFMGLAQDDTQKRVLQEALRNSKLFITPEGELGHVEEKTEQYPGQEVRFI